jgi:hypothetical protein
MPNGELLTRAQSAADWAIASAEDLGLAAVAARGWILETFGQNGLYAAYLVGLALGLYAVMQIARMTFAAVKYLILPGVALALVGSFVSPYSFFFLLPITMTGCSLVLLFKG